MHVYASTTPQRNGSLNDPWVTRKILAQKGSIGPRWNTCTRMLLILVNKNYQHSENNGHADKQTQRQCQAVQSLYIGIHYISAFIAGNIRLRCFLSSILTLQLDMCLWNTDSLGSNKLKIYIKISKSYILTPPHPRGIILDVSEVWAMGDWGQYTFSSFSILYSNFSTRHVFVKHRCPRWQQSQNISI